MLPSKPIIAAIVPGLAPGPLPDHAPVLESLWSDPLVLDLVFPRPGGGAWIIVWDVTPGPQQVTHEGQDYDWYLLAYFVEVTHPDGREEIVYSGVYGDPAQTLTSAQHLFLPDTLPDGRYAFSIVALGQVYPVAAAA